MIMVNHERLKKSHAESRAITSPTMARVESSPTRRVTEDDVAGLLGTLTRTYGQRPATMVQKEIQDLIGIGSTQVSEYVRSGRIPAHYFLTIALEAFALGDPGLIESVLPEGYTLTPLNHGSLNGRVDDDELEVISSLDQARHAFEKGNKRDAKKHLRLAKTELATFEAEISR